MARPAPRPLTPLSRHYFAREAVPLARALLGCLLVHDSPLGRTVGRIVETEAYDQSEPASHSARGPTPRNRVMFGPPGHLYVYFSYGVHWCANVVAGREGAGAAVLLRALEPVEGLELMARRRGLAEDADPRLLASGPGRLAQAMGLGREHDGLDLCAGPAFVARRPRGERVVVRATPRIGISKAVELPWRFVVQGSRCVSRDGRQSGGVAKRRQKSSSE